MTALIHFGIRPPRLITPESSQINILEKIKPKLESKKDNFQLKSDNSIFPQVQAGADFEEAKAYGVVDLDSGEVIMGKNLSQRLPIASLTKIMTAVVALDLANLNDEFTVSENASEQVPSKIMLKAGEKISLENLLESALISSANDSAVVIQEGIDQIYGKGVFVASMNEKAQILGLKDSHFVNSQGLDNPEHFSSVEDLISLSHYALVNYPFISQTVSKQVEDLRAVKDERFYLRNWNGLLGVYPGVYGLKIGNTDKAGYTTIVAAQREGKKLLAVVLGAPGVIERDLWASELLDAGFQKAFNLPPIGVTKPQLLEKYASWNIIN